jgi:hypothetical protein
MSLLGAVTLRMISSRASRAPLGPRLTRRTVAARPGDRLVPMMPALASPRITTRGGCYPTIAAALRRRFTNQKTVLECPELLAKLEGELPS